VLWTSAVLSAGSSYKNARGDAQRQGGCATLCAGTGQRLVGTLHWLVRGLCFLWCAQPKANVVSFRDSCMVGWPIVTQLHLRAPPIKLFGRASHAPPCIVFLHSFLALGGKNSKSKLEDISLICKEPGSNNRYEIAFACW
jgi:hypothetical protein